MSVFLCEQLEQTIMRGNIDFYAIEELCTADRKKSHQVSRGWCQTKKRQKTGLHNTHSDQILTSNQYHVRHRLKCITGTSTSSVLPW
jgi:hypothetical protein